MNCSKKDGKPTPATIKREIIYSDTSISTGIIVIAEDKKLKIGDTLNMLIGLEKRKFVDSLLFIVNGRKLHPNDDGWLEYYYGHISVIGERTLHIKAKYIDIKAESPVELIRQYNFGAEMELHLINENGHLLYRNERNKINVEMSRVSSGVGPRIKIKNGKVIKTGSNEWAIIPDSHADTCFVNVRFYGCEMKYIYPVVDKPLNKTE